MKFTDRHIFLLLLIPLTLINFARGQGYIDYLNDANEAEYLFNQKELSSSKRLLDKLEAKYKLLKPKESFYLGLIYFSEKDTVNGQKHILNCVNNFLGCSDDIKSYIKKNPLVKVSNFFMNKIEAIQNTYGDKIDKDIADSLKYFFDNDQLNRSTDAGVVPAIDYQIQSQLLSFLKRKGLPNVYLYGQFHLSIFIHVYDPELLQEYKDYLLSEIKKGNLCPYYYCSMVDRNLLESSKTTLYNSYSIICSSTKCYKEIRNNRKNVGYSLYYDGTCEYPIINSPTITINYADK